ncbi:MAG TPA: hypothetical protein DCS06_01165 [Candidatus Yanofskybacteria bacterium]|nr:MAG: hypothetical protein A2241_02350 [Candidatus Yanofskybacteria bacterium RIFOXYA2_FULL_45_28]HAU07579.1 hypothetical protein [Candidatus Yanofskybacteria bacterium]HBX58718.1 hypothetical protein [Candidatus Yanofskybacteria bacterium]
MSEEYTPKEIAKATESRALSDAKLIERGAHHVPNESGKPVLRPTRKQVEALRNMNPKTRVEKEKRESTEILRTFSTPDQVGELDFKAFLEKPLFNSYYRPNIDKEGSFEDMIYNTSKSFSGIKGRLFQEILVKEKVGEKAVRAERDIKPISLNEWRYLFTQLTESQLMGHTYYLVQFEDGAVRSIEVWLDKSGGGPYGYSLSMRKLSPQDSFDQKDPSSGDYVKPRIISPAE